MKSAAFTGTITALVTPFYRGKIACDDLAKLVETQVKSGVNALVPAGTTGESPTLDHDEHLEVIRAVIAAARNRVPVIAGTGSNSTAEAVHLTRLATEAGADAVLVVTPYYNNPSQNGLFEYFTAVANATDKPLILYSIPSRCGVEIALPTIERLLSKNKNIRHIKEAGGSVDRVDQIKTALGNDITVLSGDDSLTLPFMSVGAQGVISVASNLLPKPIVQMVNHALDNNYAAARKIHRQLYPLFKTLFIEPNPVPVKTALAAAKLIRTPEVRSPLCPMTPANKKFLLATLQKLPLK
jgi:4-hydroxy-tetrahydrodipicolinate synthase